jgi:hypothetical protein
VARTNVEQTALIYVPKLLETAVNNAKKLKNLRAKFYAKSSLGELYEISGKIS